MSVLDDIITTLKEIHDRDGYTPVGIKVCKKGDEYKVYMDLAMRWMEDQLSDYRHKHGLERLKT